MIRGFLFDLDGTLLDRDASLQAFVADQHDRIAELQHLDKSAYVQRFIELDNRGYVWKDQVYRQLAQEFGLAIPWETLLDDYMAAFQRHCVGFPHLHEMLHYLKSRGLKLGIITNGLGALQSDSIRALRIEHYFDAILISEVEGVRKPEAEIFRRALHRLGLGAEEAVFVGDHPHNDIMASRSVGMKGIWKEDPYYDPAFERDGTIRDLLELLAIYEANFSD